MTKEIKYAVHMILFVGLLSCLKNLPVWASASGESDNYIATSANADYAEPDVWTCATPGNCGQAEKLKAPVMRAQMRQSRTSDVLTITGSGINDKMSGTLGEPGVYLLFQGAQYRHGFNMMISDHSSKGNSRQVDGIWEYFKQNETKEVRNLETEIWTGTGSYSNTELVKVADKITIQNSTNMDTGEWNTVVTVTNPHPKLTGVLFYYYAPHLADYGGVTIFPFGGQQTVNGAAEAHRHVGIQRTEPTCTSAGEVTGRCDMCGTINETIPALGHASPAAYDTVSVPGYKVKNCTRCTARLETIANQYQVAYLGNGATKGTMSPSAQQVGIPFLIEENQFNRTGYTFASWNTDSSGKGVQYQPGQSVQDLTMKDQDTVQLFAQWKANVYEVKLNPNGGACETEKLTVAYDAAYGNLPIPLKTDYRFMGWIPDGAENPVTEKTLYQIAGNTTLWAGWELHFEDLGNGTNRRPGEDGVMGTKDDHYYYNGEDKQPGTEDDIVLEPGTDGLYGTRDDCYENSKNQKVHCGMDTLFDTKDDYIDNGDGTNTRPGEDGKWDTEDDEKWHNGEDKQPGTSDDKPIKPGLDGEYGTKDDYIDNGDGTNTRPGEDGKWDTRDDEKWHNGEDKQPGTGDDKLDTGDNGGTGNDSGNGSDNGSGNHSGGGSGNHSGGGSGSSSGGNLGGSSGSTQGGPGMAGNSYTDIGKGKSGEWKKLPDGWIFEYTDGKHAKDEWCYLYYGVTGRTDWYRFGQDEYMKIGWHQDPDGRWYFLHTISDGTLGHMKTGWYLDTDGNWYYLNPVSDGYRGAMVTGWQLIDEKWYYFNPVPDGKMGAMYAGGVTPDGYLVGEDGARIE